MAKFKCPNYSSQLTIDLGAIRANYSAMANQVAPAICGAVVKADAYGLGASKVGKALRDEGCSNFFVAHFSEALALFDAIGFGNRIFILNGLDPGCETLCAYWGFVPVLNSMSQVERWRSAAREDNSPLPAALQINTGMTRLGIEPDAAAKLIGKPGFVDEISLKLIMTHLSCADDPENLSNEQQRAEFAKIAELFTGIPTSIANSSGSFLPASFHQDIVRSGIALFGGMHNTTDYGARPVVHLAARVIQIRDVLPNIGVGYGLDYKTPTARRLATIGVGYADGLPRQLGNVGAAWHYGCRLPIVGRVSMDSLTIDVSELPIDALREGEFVELIGPSQSLCDIARDAATISYEILTGLGSRHQRVYIEDGPTTIVAPEVQL